MDKSSHQNPKKRHTIFGLEKRRKQVIEMLSKAFINNDLDTHAYAKRVELAIQAKSIEELEEAIYDFPDQYTSPDKSQAPTIKTPPKHHFLNILRKKMIFGRNLSYPNFTNRTILGETIIDLQYVTQFDSDIVIENYNFMGNVRIKVPAYAIVRQQFLNIWGESRETIRGSSILQQILGKPKIFSIPAHITPLVIHIVGLNVLGEINIEYGEK